MPDKKIARTDAIGFDLDGTLWDAVDPIMTSWSEVLSARGEIKKNPYSGRSSGVMGLGPRDIVKKLFGYLPEKTGMEIFDACTEAEIRHMRAYGGRLFAGLEETLDALVARYSLFIVSNCQSGYIEAFLDYHKLHKYFCDFECAGRTGLSKGENLALVISRNGFRAPVFLCDTQGDADAAKAAGIPFVFARYGFGAARMRFGASTA
jgi:phosphoglycolate phosphatase